MAQTSYISTAELIESFDERMVFQLSSYSGSPIANSGALASSAVALNAIEKASAEVESYSLRGGLYSATDLTDLQTADDWSLKGLVATLTMKYLFQGKTGQVPPDMGAMIGEATQTLEDLRAGKRVFNLSGVHTAGKAKIQVISSSVRSNINMPSDQMYFPTRLTRKY